MVGSGMQEKSSDMGGIQPWDDYEDPADIAEDDDLTVEQKRQLLVQWHEMEQKRTMEQPASVAGDPPMLLRIGRALAFLDPDTGTSDNVGSDGRPVDPRIPPVEDF